MIHMHEIEGGPRGLVGGLLLGAAVLLFMLFVFVGAYAVGRWVWSLA